MQFVTSVIYNNLLDKIDMVNTTVKRTNNCICSKVSI